MIAQKNVRDCLFKFHQAPIATSKTGLARLTLLIKSKTRVWCSLEGENNDSGIQAIGMVWIALGKRQWRFLTGSLLGFLAAVKLSNTLFEHCCLVHVLYRLLPVPTSPGTHYKIKKRTCAQLQLTAHYKRELQETCFRKKHCVVPNWTPWKNSRAAEERCANLSERHR